MINKTSEGWTYLRPSWVKIPSAGQSSLDFAYERLEEPWANFDDGENNDNYAEDSFLSSDDDDDDDDDNDDDKNSSLSSVTFLRCVTCEWVTRGSAKQL